MESLIGKVIIYQMDSARHPVSFLKLVTRHLPLLSSLGMLRLLLLGPFLSLKLNTVSFILNYLQSPSFW